VQEYLISQNLHQLGPIFYFPVYFHLMMNENDKCVDEDVFLVMILEIHKQESLQQHVVMGEMFLICFVQMVFYHV